MLCTHEPPPSLVLFKVDSVGIFPSGFEFLHRSVARLSYWALRLYISDYCILPYSPHKHYVYYCLAFEI